MVRRTKARRDTNETLVESQAHDSSAGSASAAKWFKDTFQLSKRLSVDDTIGKPELNAEPLGNGLSGTDPCNWRPPRRSWTDDTVVEELDIEKNLQSSKSYTITDDISDTKLTRTSSPPPLSASVESPSTFSKPFVTAATDKTTKGEEREKESTSISSIALLTSRVAFSLGEASNIPYLKGIAGLATLILETMEGVTANKEECIRISRQVIRLQSVLSRFSLLPDHEWSPQLLLQIEQLSHTLERVLGQTRKLLRKDRRYFSKIIRQTEDLDVIVACEKELADALNLFQVQTGLDVQSTLHSLSSQSKKQHNEVLEHLQKIDNAGLHSEQSVAATTRIPERSSNNLLPVPPRIFRGRETELGTLLKQVTTNTNAHIAILGSGGIGKSTLALSLLHHPSIVNQFKDRRYFVSCESCRTYDTLLSAILNQLEPGAAGDNLTSDRLGQILLRLSSENEGEKAPRTILVLDNFETPWEPTDSRVEVEEFLSRLASLDNLTLVTTQRGVERPLHVDWTKPFLRVLEPLTRTASRQILFDIAGDKVVAHTAEGFEDEFNEILALCDDVPLAVTLMASLAMVSNPKTLLRRWKSENTSMLARAKDKTNSLDVSIALSLDSPRLKEHPNARSLLSVLALLPDGVYEDDLPTIVSDIDEASIWRCLDALKASSLIYEEKNSSELIKVLNPIRSYVARNHPLDNQFLQGFSDYTFNLTGLISEVEQVCSPAIIHRIHSELGNVESVTRHLLEMRFNPENSIKTAVGLARFHMYTSLGETDLLKSALELAKDIGNAKLEADCLLMIAYTTLRFSPSGNTAESLFMQAKSLYKSEEDIIGQANSFQQLASFYAFKGRMDDCQTSLRSAYDLHCTANNLLGQATCLISFGRLARMQSQLQEARRHADQALDLIRYELCSLPLEAVCMQFLADIEAALSNFAAAKEKALEAKRIIDDLHLSRSAHYYDATACLADLSRIQSDYSEAEIQYNEAIRAYRKLKRHDREAYCLHQLGTVYVSLGRLDEAEHLQNKSLEIWRGKFKQPWGEAICLRGLGDVAVARKEFKKGVHLYQRACNVLENGPVAWKSDLAEWHIKLGELALTQERVYEALEHIYDSLRLYQTAKHSLGMARSRMKLARIFHSSLKGTGDSEFLKDSLTLLSSAVADFETMGLMKEVKACYAEMADIYTKLGLTELSHLCRRRSLKEKLNQHT